MTKQLKNRKRLRELMTGKVGRQKYPRGAIIKIAEDLGPMMEHFSGKGCFGIVVGTYAQECADSGATNRDTYEYQIYLLSESSESAWYHEHQLRRATKKDIEGLRKGKLI